MNIPTTNKHRDWIEYYVRELNWSLMPVRPNKIPFLKGWDKFRDKPILIDTLIYWVEERGFHLGALTGDKLFYVADDDYPKHPGTVRPPKTELESTVVARTQNGGFHYYFKPFNMPNTRDILLPSREVFQIDLRGSNGQVLVPPFGNYEWVSPPTRENWTALPEKPPQAVIEIWQSRRNITPDSIISEDFKDIIGASSHRDPILFTTAISLFQKHYQDPNIFTKGLIASYLKDLNERFSPPHSDSVLEKCYTQAEKYTHQWAIAKGYLEEEDSVMEHRFSKMTDEEITEVRHYPTLKTGLDNLDIGGIPTGMNLIIGQSGAGKSWFMNHLIRSAWELNKQRSVIFTLEMDFDGLKKRMLQSYSALSFDQFVYGEDTTKGLELLREIDPIIIDYTQSDRESITPQSFLKRAHELYAQGRRVILFDHFHEIPGASINDKNQQVTEVWADAFKLLRNTYEDLWLFILVQSNKEGYKKKILTKEHTSGSSALVNKCDFFLSLNRTEDPEKNNNLEIVQNKYVKIWVDKNRRGHADKYISHATLGADGSFRDRAIMELDEVAGAEEKLKELF